MQPLVGLLIWILVLVCIGWGMLEICRRFFPEFPPARWICGVILLLMVLYFLSGQFGGVSWALPPRLR